MKSKSRPNEFFLIDALEQSPTHKKVSDFFETIIYRLRNVPLKLNFCAALRDDSLKLN